MSALTPKQKELLDYIATVQAQRGVSPSFDEMRDELGLASKSGVHRLVHALEERGFIRRKYNRARCIEIVDSPTLPVAGVHVAPISDLVLEMKRRGFVVGHYVRDSYITPKGDKRTNRRFVEIAA